MEKNKRILIFTGGYSSLLVNKLTAVNNNNANNYATISTSNNVVTVEIKNSILRNGAGCLRHPEPREQGKGVYFAPSYFVETPDTTDCQRTLILTGE